MKNVLKFFSMLLTLTMFIPITYATEVDTTNKAAPKADEAAKVPPAQMKTVPQVEVTKKPPTQVKTAPQYVSRDDEEIQEEQDVKPCENIPENVVVEPRVQQFLGCEIIQVLLQAERVESFEMQLDKNPDLPAENRLGEYPIKSGGQGRNLDDIEINNLRTLIFAEQSYHFGMEKRCRFRPNIGLHFVKGEEAVEILFSFACNLWLFVYKEEDKLEDFDPIQVKLVELHNSLFPPPAQ